MTPQEIVPPVRDAFSAERSFGAAMELDRGLEDQVTEICNEGYALIDRQELERAFKAFSRAILLVPEPRQDCTVTAGILAGLGEVYFRSKSHVQAKEAFGEAIRCRGANGNPFLHLRLGQCEFELEKDDRAANELECAYLGAGWEIFSQEDPRYREFLKGRRKLPKSKKWPRSAADCRRLLMPAFSRRRDDPAKDHPPDPSRLILTGCKLLATAIVVPLTGNLAFQLAFMNPIAGLVLFAVSGALLAVLWAFKKSWATILMLIFLAGFATWLAPTWGEDNLRCRPGTCN